MAVVSGWNRRSIGGALFISHFRRRMERWMDDELFRILLVEDNGADIYLFQKALESAQLRFELITMCDGALAMAFVRREGNYANTPAPDLAVLDLNLPKNGGLQVLRAIRESQEWAKVPVVIVSSSASPQDFAKTQMLGV